MTPTARPRQRLAPEVRRRQVLDAAVAVFSAEGFHGASMDAVAAHAGVSKPMVYAHGGTKEELFAACLRQEGDRLLTTLTQAAGSPATGDQSHEMALWAGLRAFFRAVTTRRAGWTVLYRQAATGAFSHEIAEEIAATRTRIIDRVAALLAEGIDAGEAGAAAVAPLAYTLVGAVEGLADWWLASEESSHDEGAADQLASTAMVVLWPGLDALRSGRVHPPSIASSASVSGRR